MRTAHATPAWIRLLINNHSSHQRLIFRGHYTGYRILEYCHRHGGEDEDGPTNSSHMCFYLQYEQWVCVIHTDRLELHGGDKHNAVRLPNRLTDNISMMSFLRTAHLSKLLSIYLI